MNGPEIDTSEQWFYENGGRRSGPVSKDQLLGLLESGQIDRLTLLWNHRFGHGWKALHETEILSSSGRTTEPPALPTQALRNEWVYLLGTFPLWGTLVLVFLLVGIVKSPYYVSPGLGELGIIWARDIVQLYALYQVHYVSLNVAYLLEIWWVPISFFLVGNMLLWAMDYRTVIAMGVKIRGNIILGILFVPLYLFLRGRSIIRVYPKAGWSAYFPLICWIVAVIGSVYLQDLIVANL